MVEVEALSRFTHHGPRERGNKFAVSPHTAALLKRKGLVVILGDEPTPANPSPAAGVTSSASPADPVSPEQTASASKTGATKRKKATTSEPTETAAGAPPDEA